VRLTLLIVFMAAMCSCRADADSGSPAVPAPDGSHQAVVVELFTSEGCSSCPPADALLSDLIRTQPVPNVTIIGFGEHVDYWDNLGWRDVFSSPAFTTRQSDYESRVFRTGSIYTPQAVVDGRFQLVGSDRSALQRAIANAARGAKADVRVAASPTGASELAAQIDVAIPSEMTTSHTLDVVVALVERNLATNVQRGENGGHLLKHGAVARTFTAAGAINPSSRTFSTRLTVPLEAGWKRPDLQIVAFVQDRTTKAIVGAAVASYSS
jgi:hypothetical protein